MNELESIPSSLRLLISGRDVLRESYVSHLLHQVTVYNTYGPSETTVCCSYFCCNGRKALKDGTYPIGKPVLGTQIELLDEEGKSVPAGSVGELCISGGGICLYQEMPSPDNPGGKCGYLMNIYTRPPCASRGSGKKLSNG